MERKVSHVTERIETPFEITSFKIDDYDSSMIRVFYNDYSGDLKISSYIDLFIEEAIDLGFLNFESLKNKLKYGKK